MKPARDKKSKTVAWEGVVTPIQENILIALHKHMYLTHSQLLKIGVGTTQYTYLWKQITSMRDRRNPLVVCKAFYTPQPKRGRVESLYFLSKHGRRFLVNVLGIPEEEIRAPRGTGVAYKDYFHRKHTIDFHIELSKWCESNDLELQFFNTYFDKSGNNRTNKNLRAKTRIDLGRGAYIIPDAIFMVEGSHQPELYLFEMHNGRDSKRAINQIHRHSQAMVSKSVHGEYNIDELKSYRVLYLFEHDSIKEAVIARAKKEAAFSVIQEYILLKSLQDLNDHSLGHNWNTLLGYITDLKR